MAPRGSDPWTTDPDYIDLLNFVIQKANDAKPAINILQLIRDFRKESGAAQTDNCLQKRIKRMRNNIHSFEHIDKKEKVRLLFALSAPIAADFLEELKEDALVEVDDKKRITKYEAIDGSWKLNGDHSVSAKMRSVMLDCKQGHRSLMIDYFKNKNDANTEPKNKEEKEMKNLIELITEKCESVHSPLSIRQLTKDCNNRFEIPVPLETIHYRIQSYGREIQKIEFLDTHTKVKQLFGISATVDPDYLKKLRENASVEVDVKNRIVHYKATDGSLELTGDHSQSAKRKAAQTAQLGLESQRRLRSMINNYFENKNNADAVPKNKREEEIWNLIEFITERCVKADSPLNICQLTNVFNKHFETSMPLANTRARIKSFCREIQTLEYLDTHSKVKQLFCLSATLDMDFLKELRKTAVVEVDHKNRIIEYTRNDNSLYLLGSHYGSKMTKPRRVEKKKEKIGMATADNSEEESDDERSNDSSDEYSSEEFDSEFDSDDENDHLDETEDLKEPSEETDDFDNETPVRSRSEMAIDDNFDLDPPTERSHRSEDSGMREDEEKENDLGITENTGITTRSGRLSKKRHLDCNFSYNPASSSGTSKSSSSLSSKSAKQKKRAEEQTSSSWSRSSSRTIRRSTRHSSFPSISTESEENMDHQEASRAEEDTSECHGSRIQEMEDYDYNPREDNHPGSSPIDNNLEEPRPPTAEEHSVNNETQNTDKGSDAVAPEPKPEKESLTLQTNGNEFISIENHIQILESLLHMMDTLDTPTFAEDQMRIEKTIEKFKSIGNEEEKIRLNELRTSLMTCLLIVEKSAKKEIVKGEDTTSFKEFLLVFHNFLVSLKLKELDGFVSRVKYMTKELKVKDKMFPTKKIQFALQSILEIIAP